MVQLPRLTSALRAFSGVSSGSQANGTNTISLQEKRQLQSARLSKSEVTLDALTAELLKRCVRGQEHQLQADVKELCHAASAIVGDIGMEYIHDAAVVLFRTLSPVDKVGREETTRLKAIFGPFPASAVNKAMKSVKGICSCLSEGALSSLTCFSSRQSQEIKEFGQGIHFSHEGLKLVTLSERPGTEPKSAQMNREDFSTANANVNGAAESLFTEAWLFERLHKIFGEDSEFGAGLPPGELCDTLIDILSTSQSDSVLQNELFELLGSGCLDLIQDLLDHRSELVQSAASQRQKEFRGSVDVSGVAGKKQPTVAPTVTVQSEKERQLLKQYRKDERRMAKKDGTNQQGAASNRFDPRDLRAHRESLLQEAAHTPLFSNPYAELRPIRYPNVYDSFSEARKSSSFIGGCKMILPVGFERKVCNMYEEVSIPPSDPPPMTICNDRVNISQLDEIAQLAFQGMKKLNRVQSVVCETAYGTNENLLVCAPTGAGKTNVAMLTVLHELLQHVQHGVLQKKDFKIIYIAPMKALAAEMVSTFGSRLQALGVAVRELTGDMQLTKREIVETQMIVTTPEKWDVVTRKSTGDVALAQAVRLLIIDEVHILNDDRGHVIESLVARTLRQVETSQSMIRIVGLSATVPNYLDVARFLNVNPEKGLFFFDSRFRPVPLRQTYIGIKSTSRMQQLQDMEQVCYEKVEHMVRQSHQILVFVHARNATVRTATALRDMATSSGNGSIFCSQQSSEYGAAEKQVNRSRNKQLRDLFPDGFGIHHAGMLRQDRNLMERLFSRGLIRVLVCTATLAWGVNLPAHAVVIKGTQIYDAKRGSFVDLSILDVMQIFGRAGRPQYDTFGEGVILTTHDKLSHYLSLMTQQTPIESQFIQNLTDNLNAEVSLGTVTNVEEAVRWLSYTYLFVRMKANPLAYGISYTNAQKDPDLEDFRRELIVAAGRQLDKARMIRFEERTGYLHPTDPGRTASHFYIKHDSVQVYNEFLKPLMTESDILAMVAKSHEFDQIKVRDDEMSELDELLDSVCPLPVPGGVENSYGKVNILLQTYICRHRVDSFSLMSDMAYTVQNAGRILRGLFEITLRKGWPLMAGKLLELSKVVDRQLWPFEHPLHQFSILSKEILHKLEARSLSVHKIKDLQADEIGRMIHHVRMGKIVKQAVYQLPSLELDAAIQPITRTVLRVRLTISPTFTWNDRVHGTVSEPWWIWVEDPENHHIYHSEYFLIQKKQVKTEEAQTLVFTIPIFEPLPSQYYVRAISDRWLGAEAMCAISFQHLILPERHPPHTELLDLQPLPVTALRDPSLESLYNFTHFNPIQTQIFHTMYHTDTNALLGAPTGSGKTVAAELAIFRIFREYPKTKAVYIAPLKALVRERIEDWKIRFEKKLGKRVVELTGDVTPDMRAISQSDVIVTTPEKWDGVSRSWQTRSYVKAVTLLIIDEIHLLGEDRGPVLEVIVSRTNFISSHTDRSVRVVGLSTALANARDLADWLGINQLGMFNFRPSVRPVPLEVHIHGYPGKHYCPRMATMNKPTFQAVRTHSPLKPALVFVSSRRQTRLTALDLIAFLAVEDNPKQWLHMPENEMEAVIKHVHDNNLKLTLAFGIGLHHAGLHERDRKTVEELFVHQKIQVLIATSTLAWGVNFPAHLVVVKGTEYFDGKTCRYVDFPITDVLQMMGRAGRPQYDDQGKAVILVHDIKKHFYKKFLYEPFPVESSLLSVLAEHLNAEIVAGTITSKQDAMDYITWTYFFRRLVMNPSYYELEDADHDSINTFLSGLVEKALLDLESCYCITTAEDNRGVEPQTLGRIASYYYLSHYTVKMFRDRMTPTTTMKDLISLLSDTKEYAELPVRHNEDALNSELAKHLPLEVDPYSYDSSHTKAHLLLQAHFSRQQLPSTDYLTDTKSVLDQALRILQAMTDVTADEGWLIPTLSIMQLIQMAVQGCWSNDPSLLNLPHIQKQHLQCFRSSNGRPIQCLPELMAVCRQGPHILRNMLRDALSPQQIEQVFKVVQQLPLVDVAMSVVGWWDDNPDQQQTKPVTITASRRKTDSEWIKVHADQQYVLQVNLACLNKMGKRKAHAPRFPKAKDEGWWLVLGDMDKRELLAMKRLGPIRQQRVPLAFYTPEAVGRYLYVVYLMSDCYVGLDQQYDVALEVIPADIQTQVNSEVVGE
ncbi:activating signal cointegrator 1 complex subunit 3-like [Branchiostoma lanceolatum]|uniref:activating signal cointegrator 1 complex subunit 3-like n=1 Tax=Branchiostoma lanceolatum TaxID=7740 RepID=UPI003453726A